MEGVTRDALAATVTGAALLAVLAVTGSLSRLGEPAAVAVGVAMALAVEALFVADTPAGRLWQRRWARAGSAVALVGGGAVAVWLGGPWVVAAACWGLVTYFVLLGLLLTGVWEPAG